MLPKGWHITPKWVWLWSCDSRHSFLATACTTVRPMLSDRCLSCPVLSVTLVYCGQTVGWIRIPFGVEVGLDAVHIVLDGDPAPPTEHSPQFSARCGQTAGWIKMPHGTEVDLGQGDIVLDRDLAPPKKRHSSLHFSAHIRCGQTAEWIKLPLGTEVSLDRPHC